LSCVYDYKKDYVKSLQHAEKACELLGDKEWTGNLAPLCKEGVAYALLNLNVPSQSDAAKAAYVRSVEFLNEAIRLKKKNNQTGQTPLYGNYDSLAQAYLFLDDYVSALDSAQKAQALRPCQKYIIKEGLALLGLERYPEANKLFHSVRSTDPRLADALVEYSNNLAINDADFCAADVWAFMR